MNYPLIETLRDSYTSLKRNHPDSEYPKEFTVWLDIGVQHFCVSNISMPRDEAEWTRRQLAIALANLLGLHALPPPAPESESPSAVPPAPPESRPG
jgi:hypothetical protein